MSGILIILSDYNILGQMIQFMGKESKAWNPASVGAKIVTKKVQNKKK